MKKNETIVEQLLKTAAIRKTPNKDIYHCHAISDKIYIRGDFDLEDLIISAHKAGETSGFKDGEEFVATGIKKLLNIGDGY